MTDREQYAPGPASGGRYERTERSGRSSLSENCATRRKKSGRRLPTPCICTSGLPLKSMGMATVGMVKLTWVGTPTPLETRVMRADAPKVLEYSDIRWELEAFGGGTRLTLWHNIDRRFISWGAAGWHICFDVLERLLAGEPIGRIVGAEAMKFGGWQRLNVEYAKQFGIEMPNWPPQASQKS
jgi:hypothetical protein